MDVPKPSDDDFEVQLAWSPPPLSSESAVRPGPRAPVRRSAGPRRSELDERRHDEVLGLQRSVLRVEEELVAVRQAMLDAPQLDQLAQELRQLSRDMSAAVAQVHEELAALRAAVRDHVGPSADDLEAVKAEMIQLRRRIGLKASTEVSEADDAMVERVADAAVARLTSHQWDGGSSRSRRGRSR